MEDNKSRLQEAIEIENFGGLTKAEIPISQFNLFIGPQASGKSIAAKAIYFCKSYLREMISAQVEEQKAEQFHTKLGNKFIDYFRAAAQDGNFRISYRVKEDFVEIKAGRARKHGIPRIEFNTSEGIEREYTNLRRLYGKSSKKLQGAKEKDADFRFEFEILLKLRLRLYNRFRHAWNMNQLFIPAGRSYFSFLQGSIFSLLSSNIPLDPFIREFGSNYERYKSLFFRRIEGGNQFGKELDAILRGRYVRADGEDYIVNADSRRVPVSCSSSGQQEALPLLVMLRYFHLSRAFGGTSVYIEEPEAHLFPESQQRLMELLAFVFSARRGNYQLFITTHSPYICAAINNLLLAGSLLERYGQSVARSLRSITKFGANINFTDLSAMALADGTAKQVLDSGLSMIDPSYLDAVSNVLMSQREDLLALEGKYSANT